MRLTQFSNFAVRILMYTGLKKGQPSAVPDIARAYGISQNHLNKVAAELCHLGYLQATRGRAGGVCLGVAADKISIGELLRKVENTSTFVECFDEKLNTCPLIKKCKFRHALQRALDAFFSELDKQTLSDFINEGDGLAECLGIKDANESGRQTGRRKLNVSTDVPAL
ncbi:MAG: Rrf2 family transcriptional regulator [Rhodospirillaceae bacterium]